MKLYVQLKCSNCGTETDYHETGCNTYDIYPCKKCYPEDAANEE